MSPFRDNGSCKAYQSRNGITEGKSLETTMPIAIIGMSCRFPGDATSPEKLWQLCADGRSAWSEIPPERFNQDAFYHPQGENMGTVSRLCFQICCLEANQVLEVECQRWAFSERGRITVRCIFLQLLYRSSKRMPTFKMYPPVKQN